MEIKASDVKALREATGAGLMDCKKALTEANGDAKEAEKILEQKIINKKKTKIDALRINIKEVIFNDPAVIIKWKDGTKTVVKCQKGEKFDPEKGLALALVKYLMGNIGYYNTIFKDWID